MWNILVLSTHDENLHTGIFIFLFHLKYKIYAYLRYIIVSWQRAFFLRQHLQ